jgi:hypothetical protein
MRVVRVRIALIAVVVLALSQSAHSHGIAGNRYFDGTLTIDDPAVADEAILPYFVYFDQSTEGNKAIENRINWSFARLLTPTLAVTLMAAGYTNGGQAAAHQASIPRILA